MKLINRLMRRAPVEILICIFDNQDKSFPLLIAKNVDVTYSHTCKVLDEMIANKLLTYNKHGRTKYVDLTEKGKLVVNHLMEIKNLLNNNVNKFI